LDRSAVHLADVIRYAVDSIRPAADAKRIAIHIDLPEDLPTIVGDTERLQQVFWNLLSNAVKFTPDEGTVDVVGGRAASHIDVAIRDSGVGLTPEFLPFAFDRFRQGDQSFTRTHGGLGLGLAIVKQLVDMHGGRVWAESAGRGQGATFRVRLPVQEAAPTDLGDAPAAAAALTTRLLVTRFS
jgi:signal transduction histidine kinase